MQGLMVWRHPNTILHTYEEDHSNALCPIDEGKSSSHIGENIEIQPMTTAEMRQYFNKHTKTMHQLGLQLNQLMISVSSHHSPQTMQLIGPGMVSSSLHSSR